MLYNLDSYYRDGHNDPQPAPKLWSCSAVPGDWTRTPGKVALALCVGVDTFVTLYTRGDKLPDGGYEFFIGDRDSARISCSFGSESHSVFRGLGQYASGLLDLHKQAARREYAEYGADAIQRLRVIFSEPPTTARYWDAILSMGD